MDIKCQELALDEARAEAELKRIKIERTKLNATKIELNVKLYQEQLTQLELKKANDFAKIEAEYLKEKGKILSMMQVTTSIQTNPQCTSN
jgi:hypothetical protein